MEDKKIAPVRSFFQCFLDIACRMDFVWCGGWGGAIF